MSASIRSAARIATVAPRRLISTSVRLMGAGSTGSGSSRPGGERAGDAFTRREKPIEDYFIHEQEKAKLEAMRKKLDDHSDQLEGFKQALDDLLKKGSKSDTK